MRLLLIQASQLNRVNPEIIHPMGLLCLAAVSRRAGHTVRIIDMRFHNGGLEKDILSFKPGAIGISGLTHDAKFMASISKAARKAAPNTQIVVGGPHATAYWDSVLNETGADAAVLGEGEATLLELLEAYDNGRPLDEIAGIVYLRNGETRRAAPRPFIENLDSLPQPAWDLIDIDRYCYDTRFVDLRARRRFMTVFTSRGCPYQCIFCHQVMGKRYRSRSAENVLDEIKFLYDNYGIRDIEFEDDAFNLDRPRAMSILQGIIDSGMDLKIAFRNGLRGDRIDAEMLRKMKDAGTYHVGFAFETGTERLQNLIGKHLQIPNVIDAVEEAARLGMFTRGFFMLGFPTERRNEIQATIDIALKSRLHVASFFIVTAFRGTPIYEMAKDMGKFIDLDYEQLDYNSIRLSLCEVPIEELIAMQRTAYLNFFTSPDRLFRIARDLPNKKQIPRYIEQLLRRTRFIR